MSSRAAGNTCGATCGTRTPGERRSGNSIARPWGPASLPARGEARPRGRRQHPPLGRLRAPVSPDDFRLRSLYGVAEDWPISYQDLEPHYAAAEQALGVAGAMDEPWGPPAAGRSRSRPSRSATRTGCSPRPAARWASPSISCLRRATLAPRGPTAVPGLRNLSRLSHRRQGQRRPHARPRGRGHRQRAHRHRGDRPQAGARPIGRGERGRLRGTRQGRAAADRPRVRGRRRGRGERPSAPPVRVAGSSRPASRTGAGSWESSSCRTPPSR